MDFKDFPYKTFFDAPATSLVPSDENKYLAKASLDSLGQILKVTQEQVDDNPDLLYLSSDIFVAGMANKRGDAVSREDGIILANQIPHKYLNLEHEELQVVGALFDYGFRQYGNDSNVISRENIGKYSGPYTVAGAGYIWKSVHPKLASYLESASAKNSENYLAASMSWEVFFKGYNIMLGSKFVDEAEIITDATQIKELSPYLKQNGGEGVYQGAEIYRVINGPKVFLGAGIVKNPAADVKGIFTFPDVDYKEEEQKIAANQESKQNTGKTSQSKKVNVKRVINIMKIKNLEDVEKVCASFVESDEVDQKQLIAFASAVPNFIKESLREASEKFVKEKEAAEQEKVAAAEEAAKLRNDLEALKASKEDVESKLEELRSRLDQEEQNRLFNERMGALDAEYDLDDATSKAIASQIKGLDEEAYGQWLDSFKIFAAEKSKSFKKEQARLEKEAAEKAIALAQKEKSEKSKEDKEKEVAEKAIASAQENAGNSQTPNSEHQPVSLEDKFATFKLELEGK